MNLSLKTFFYGLIIGWCSVINLHAAATRIAFQDAFATARGNAFAATADSPSAVFYNAAGITQIEGTAVRGNVFAISLGYEYDGPGGIDAEMDDEFQAVPSFFVSHNIEGSPLSIGFGAYSPFALGSDWGESAPFAPLAYEAQLKYIKHHAVLAWQITETLSVAGGLSYDDTDIELRTGLIDFEGDDDTIGYSLSILWQPGEHHSFGLNYQGETETDYQGRAQGILTGGFRLSSKATLNHPESIIFGYSFRPSEKWNIEFNLDWTNWDKVNALTLDGVPNASYNLNWESAFIWELGITRYFDNRLYASAGYTFVENAVPSEDFLPVVPDSDRHFFGLGIGQNIGHFQWDITYQYTYDDGRQVSGNNYEANLGTPINGSWDLDSQALAASLSYSF